MEVGFQIGGTLRAWRVSVMGDYIELGGREGGGIGGGEGVI